MENDNGRLTTSDNRAYAAQERFSQYVEGKLGRGIFGAECEIFLSAKASKAAGKLKSRWTGYKFIETGWVGAKP